MTFLALYWKECAVALIVAALLSVAGYYKLEAGAAGVREAEAKQELAEYKAETQAQAARQSREALAITVANERKKEHADAQNAAALAAAHADAARLRVERDAAVSRFLSAAPAASKCPDGQACFIRAEFDAAYRILVGEVRAVADECSALTVDLNSAKLWALDRLQPTPSSAP